MITNTNQGGVILRTWQSILSSSLLVVIAVACVPVPVTIAYRDQDIAYEHLEEGIYYLKVSASPKTDASVLKQRWDQQASRLCKGSFHDDARIFHRHEYMSRERVVDYQQMRGNVFCH